MFITLLQKCLESQDLIVYDVMYILHVLFLQDGSSWIFKMTDYIKVLLEKKFIFFVKNVYL